MSVVAAVPPLGSISTTPLSFGGIAGTARTSPAAETGFADLLMQGLRGVDARLNAADVIVRRFALDDDVPVHQVTMALEEARLSLDLAMQVRGRLVEGYRELMNMQL